MKKADLRQALTKLNVPYIDSETVKELTQKLNQAEMQGQGQPPVPFQPFMLMDAEDEGQILAEIQGAMIDKFVFCFKDRAGNEVIGLSKAGVDQICRESANRGEVYRIMETKDGKMDMELLETDKTYQVRVRVGRYALIKDKNGMPAGEQLLDTHVGSKQQPKYKKLKTGELVLDPFGYEVACSKAIRNAKRDLLPSTLLTEMIKRFRTKGQVKVVDIDEKATENQIKFIHGVGSECGLSHDQMTALVKKIFGYDSIADLRVREVNDFVNKMKLVKRSNAFPEMDFEVIGFFNEKGVTLPAKREAEWRGALQKCENNIDRAKKYLAAKFKDN